MCNPLIIAVTLLLSWLLTGLATWYASRMGLLDQPGDRHSHAKPTGRITTLTHNGIRT